MAVAFVRAHTGVSIKTAGTTNLGVNISTVTLAGDLLVAHILFDNAAVASKPVVSSIAKAAGETANWSLLGAARSTSTTAGAFASGEMWVIRTTVAWPVASYTVTLDTTTVMKATLVAEFSGVTATPRSTAGAAYSTTTTAASATTTGTTPVIGDLALGLLFQSNSVTGQGDNDTLGGAWVSTASVGSTGGNVATNNIGSFSYKILTTASHQTHNSLTTATAGNGAIVAILQAAPDPAVTQAAYRWYDEGTEAGSVALSAQDTAVTGDIANGDATGTLRIRLQSTTAVAVEAFDDWQLQYQRNGGTWTNVSAVTTVAATYDSPNLTNGAATTNRLTGGTGTFVPGKISEDSLMDDLGWAGNNYTELVYALKIKAADVAHGDAINFRVLRNNSTATLTYVVTPTINIIQTPVAITQAAYRFYADGTEAGSVALAAQNTAPSVSVSGGDVNLQLRALLQSTNTGTIPATDDFKLQWEKNGSGAWSEVSAVAGLVLADSYYDADVGAAMTGGPGTAQGQSFIGNGNKLARVSFYMNKAGTPGGNVQAALYAHTGTFGNGRGVGTPLALSTTIIAGTALSTTPTWTPFDFDSTFVLTNGTPYVITVGPDATMPLNNHVALLHDSISPTHPGNRATLSSTGTWTAQSTSDAKFQLYTVAATVATYDSASLTEGQATTNRLTGGTGTFTAGKVSEDGEADNLGWPGNNYTEVVYSLTLKQADLANGDTLRFRVLRNDATSTLTYSQTPTITIGSGAVTAPVTSFSASATTINAGQTVTFTDTSTGDAATSWAWDFGVGASPATATTKGPHTVTYSTVGTSSVTYSATNSAGTVAATPKSITVNAAPTATGRPKVWTGAAWANKPAKVWTGAAWVEKPVKVWTGTQWKLVT